MDIKFKTKDVKLEVIDNEPLLGEFSGRSNPNFCFVDIKEETFSDHSQESESLHGELIIGNDVEDTEFDSKSLLINKSTIKDDIIENPTIDKQCAICTKVFSSNYKLRRHTISHTSEKPFECKVCNYKTAQKYNLNSHMKIHTGEKPPHPPSAPSSILDTPVSTFIPIQVNNISTLGDPTQTVSNSPSGTLANTELSKDKKHACDICRKTFKRREHLNHHVNSHMGLRPFKCEKCAKSFMRKEHLQRHMTLHSGQKSFTCNVCKKSFARNDNLLKHKQIHKQAE